MKKNRNVILSDGNDIAYQTLSGPFNFSLVAYLRHSIRSIEPGRRIWLIANFCDEQGVLKRHLFLAVVPEPLVVAVHLGPGLDYKPNWLTYSL